MSGEAQTENGGVHVLPPEAGQALEQLPPQQTVVPAPQPPTLAVTPQASAKDLVARLDAIKEAQKEAMEKNVDYGVIPGTDKPTLFKPGAEKLAALFQLDVQPQNEKRWEEDGHLTVISRVTIFHAPTGARLGSGEGICTTHEKKYGKRTANLTCPSCDEETVFRSKHPPRDNPDAEPGWFCWAKKGGCGANFAADDEKITGQDRGQIDNPDLPDLWNTVDKMATKRALVAAVLIVTGASAVFTQDIEDLPGEARDSTHSSAEKGPPQKTAPNASASVVAKLDSKKVDHLRSGFAALELNYQRIGVLLSKCGISGLRVKSPQAVTERLETLTTEQADKLEAELNRLSQDQETEAPDEEKSDA
jgi:hypothetical protein